MGVFINDYVVILKKKILENKFKLSQVIYIVLLIFELLKGKGSCFIILDIMIYL